jgi:hypothetical protein
MCETLEEVLHLLARVIDLQDIDDTHEVDLTGVGRSNASILRCEQRGAATSFLSLREAVEEAGSTVTSTSLCERLMGGRRLLCCLLCII